MKTVSPFPYKKKKKSKSKKEKQTYSVTQIHAGCSKRSKSHPEKVEETIQFFTIFQYCLLDINTLGPMILKHFPPITEEDGILALQNLIHSTYDIIVVFKMATTQVRFEFKKTEGI